MVDARSARQSIDGRQLFVAEPPMKQCEAGAVGRVQASDGRSFASMPHHMLHDLRVSRRSDGISESIAIRLNERRSEGASMSDCVCERGAALLCKAMRAPPSPISCAHHQEERARGRLAPLLLLATPPPRLVDGVQQQQQRERRAMCPVSCARLIFLSSFSTGLLPRSFARNRNKLTCGI